MCMRVVGICILSGFRLSVRYKLCLASFIHPKFRTSTHAFSILLFSFDKNVSVLCTKLALSPHRVTKVFVQLLVLNIEKLHSGAVTDL